MPVDLPAPGQPLRMTPTSSPSSERFGSMRRVSRRARCAICGRPDWCLAAEDGSAAICARIEEGSVKRCGDAGWLHVFRERERSREPRRIVLPLASAVPLADLSALALRCQQAASQAMEENLADELGLTSGSLRRLGLGWGNGFRSRTGGIFSAWSFPMRNPVGDVLGLRLRTSDGRKFAAFGGHEGLFIPDGLTFAVPLLIAEGPTDTAALLDMGFEAVGRPCCTGGTRLVVDLLKARRPPGVVIVSDLDANGDGQRGAESLASALAMYSASVRVIRGDQGRPRLETFRRDPRRRPSRYRRGPDATDPDRDEENRTWTVR